jgi:hypothetical protein
MACRGSREGPFSSCIPIFSIPTSWGREIGGRGGREVSAGQGSAQPGGVGGVGWAAGRRRMGPGGWAGLSTCQFIGPKEARNKAVAHPEAPQPHPRGGGGRGRAGRARVRSLSDPTPCPARKPPLPLGLAGGVELRLGYLSRSGAPGAARLMPGGALPQSPSSPPPSLTRNVSVSMVGGMSQRRCAQSAKGRKVKYTIMKRLVWLQRGGVGGGVFRMGVGARRRGQRWQQGTQRGRARGRAGPGPPSSTHRVYAMGMACRVMRSHAPRATSNADSSRSISARWRGVSDELGDGAGGGGREGGGGE